jgi:Sulfotransferase family
MISLDQGRVARRRGKPFASRICPAENVRAALIPAPIGGMDCGDDAMNLPTFVVIGAMKAGTVSLGNYLEEHPDVFLARSGRMGEPNFFISEQNWPRGRGWYESLFDGAGTAAAIGECSPGYTWAHTYRGVPERMAQMVPGARLVYLVRDPIARMRSMYMHQVSAGRERRRPEVALLDDRYLGPSRYGFQLAAFLDHFDRGQVLVIASEVLRDEPRAALSAVFDHLGVDPAAVDLDKRLQDHRSMDKPVPRLHDLTWLPRRQLKLDPRWRPDQRTGLARVLTTRRARADDSAIPRELRDRLAERLAGDLGHFEQLLGHPVPSRWKWSTSVPA